MLVDYTGMMVSYFVWGTIFGAQPLQAEAFSYISLFLAG